MHKFTSIDSYYISGRGLVFMVECPIECPRDKLYSRLGPNVSVDGDVYKLSAVEAFAVAPPTHIGERIGLCVYEEVEWV